MTELLLVSVENPEIESAIASYENHTKAVMHFDKLKEYFNTNHEENISLDQ